MEDFVRMFNSHREANFNPSSYICVDESMVRWYGNGGHWINIGLPMYVEMDRKPENGCEIHSACCGESGIMLRLKLRKTGRATAREECAEADKDLNEGAKVLKELAMPWAKTDCLAVADSCFASVVTAEACCKIGLRFIGVVKTATRKFPYQCLQACELEERGSFKALFHHKIHESDPDIMAFIWMDRDRRCFVSTCSNLRDADPIIRTRWRQVSPVEDNEDPVPVTLSIPVPNCAQLYYDNCGKIDQHNRIRQAGLCIEKKAGTKDWSKRVNLSVFSMCVVDSFLAYRGCTLCEETFNEFICKLAEEMIDYEMTTRHQRASTAFNGWESPRPKRMSGVQLTPQKKLRPNPTTPSGKENKGQARLQKWCRVCGVFKSTWVCRNCLGEVPICHPKEGRECFVTHCTMEHGGETIDP